MVQKKGWGRAVTDDEVASLEEERRGKEASLAAACGDLVKRAEGMSLCAERKAGKGGKLFGKVTSKDVQALLCEGVGGADGVGGPKKVKVTIEGGSVEKKEQVIKEEGTYRCEVEVGGERGAFEVVVKAGGEGCNV